MCLGCRRPCKLQVEAVVWSGSGFHGGQIQRDTSRRLVRCHRKLKLNTFLFSVSPYVCSSIGLSNAISLSVHACVFVLNMISLSLWSHIDSSHRVPDFGLHTKRADCSDRQTCCVYLSGFAGSSGGLTPPVKRNFSPFLHVFALFQSPSHHTHSHVFLLTLSYFT